MPMKGADQDGPAPTKLVGGSAPIKVVSRHAWSPGIYPAYRLMGKPLDVAWENVFICSFHF